VAAESQSASSSLEPFDPAIDHFARLGFERAWTIDRGALEDNYLERSQVVHPDRFVGADSATRRASIEHSSALNTAYRVLRNPVDRAEYLVRLGGIDLDSSDASGGAPHPTQAFLIEMIERRERLEEVRDDSEDALDQLREEVESELESVFATALAGLEARDLPAVAAALVHRRYLQRFHDEIEAAQDA